MSLENIKGLHEINLNKVEVGQKILIEGNPEHFAGFQDSQGRFVGINDSSMTFPITICRKDGNILQRKIILYNGETGEMVNCRKETINPNNNLYEKYLSILDLQNP